MRNEMPVGEAIAGMIRVLADADFAATWRNPNAARLKKANELWKKVGLDSRTTEMLWRFAQHEGDKPTRLFAYWIHDVARAADAIDRMRQHSDFTNRLLNRTLQAEAKRSPSVSGIVHDLAARRHA